DLRRLRRGRNQGREGPGGTRREGAVRSRRPLGCHAHEPRRHAHDPVLARTGRFQTLSREFPQERRERTMIYFLGLTSKKAREAVVDPLFNNNPIALQVLGICSALAVTTKLETSLVMSAAVIGVTACSNTVISFIRNGIPSSI